MKEWLVSAGLALAALLLFWALMFPKVGGSGDSPSRPISTERGGAGYLALDRWLLAEKVAVVHWHSRYSSQMRPAVVAKVPAAAAAPAPAPAPAGGDVLITTMPHRAPVRRAEQEALADWVARGNTLLVMAALDDTPQWSALAYSSDLNQQVERLTRLKFTVVEPTQSDDAHKVIQFVDAALAEPIVALEPIETALGPHPLFAGVESVSARSDLPASRWQATSTGVAAVLELARRRDTGDAAVWLTTIGKGSVIVSGFATPFSNERIGVAGNARWLGNILTQSLGPHGRVILDDAHQGVVDYYDPQAFFGDPRLHHALWWIVLVWFAYVLGAPHLRQAPAGRAPIDDAAMLRMTARFYAGAITAPTAGARLIEHFFNSVRRRRSLREDGNPVWEWLEAQARIPREQLDELKTAYARASAGRSINLIRLQTLLSNLSGHLA